MPATQEARVALVQTLQDFLSAFPTALSRLPSDVAVLKAQRAVTVLDKALGEIQDRLR